MESIAADVANPDLRRAPQGATLTGTKCGHEKPGITLICLGYLDEGSALKLSAQEAFL